MPLLQTRDAVTRRLRTCDWVHRARELWGEVYDYSKVDYRGARTPVQVICPTHGSWFPLPMNHVRATAPRGCPGCRGGSAKPFAAFVKEARAAHATHYFYDENTYLASTISIRIVCPEHGEFWQIPHVHLRGSGCSRCAKRRVSEATRANSYREVAARISSLSQGSVAVVEGTFEGVNRKAKFICKVHGQYERSVNTALHSTHPCVRCGPGKRTVRPTTEVIDQLLTRWPQYEVKPFEHSGRSTRVTLACPRHGDFHMLIGSIYRSPGCPRCATARSQAGRNAGLKAASQLTLERRRETWIRKAREVHGDEYDYSNVQYSTARIPVRIQCRRHGFFWQPPSTHLQSGCRVCADEELKGLYSERYFLKNPHDATREALIYYLRLSWKQHNFFKVGITRTTLEKRFGLLARSGVRFEAISTRMTTLLDAFQSEQVIMSEHVRGCAFEAVKLGLAPRALRLGASECFTAPLRSEYHLRLVGAVRDGLKVGG